MNIAIDISPITKERSLHKPRGVGSYIKNLTNSLRIYFPDYKYTFFSSPHEIPPDTDVVHYPYFDPFFLTLPVLKSAKTVVTIHDLIPIVFSKHFPVGIKGRIKWEIQKFLLSRVDAIITDSESSCTDINVFTKKPQKDIYVVYLAAADSFKQITLSEKIKKSIRKKYKLPNEFVLYVGDVTWNKNLPGLLRAVEKVNIPLAMVGKSLMQENVDLSNKWNLDLIEVRTLASKSNKVLMLGFVLEEELMLLYNLATLCVLPSFYEGFGLTILEAMSSGCPVVTTRQGSIPEVAGNAAKYINPFSVDDMVDGIVNLFTSKSEQKRYTDLGLKQSKKFSWKKTAEETLSIYKKILHKD